MTVASSTAFHVRSACSRHIRDALKFVVHSFLLVSTTGLTPTLRQRRDPQRRKRVRTHLRGARASAHFAPVRISTGRRDVRGGRAAVRAGPINRTHDPV